MSKFHGKALFHQCTYPCATSINTGMTLIMALLFNQTKVIMAFRNDIIWSTYIKFVLCSYQLHHGLVISQVD